MQKLRLNTIYSKLKSFDFKPYLIGFITGYILSYILIVTWMYCIPILATAAVIIYIFKIGTGRSLEDILSLGWFCVLMLIIVIKIIGHKAYFRISRWFSRVSKIKF